MLDDNPWADEPPVEPTGAGPEPAVEQQGAVVSVTFKAHGGYDAPWTVIRGSLSGVAQAIAAEDNGKLSAIMKQVAKVDTYYKQQIGGPGKA